MYFLEVEILIIFLQHCNMYTVSREVLLRQKTSAFRKKYSEGNSLFALGSITTVVPKTIIR